MSEMTVTFHDGSRTAANGDSVHWDRDAGKVTIHDKGTVVLIAHIDAVKSIEGTFAVTATGAPQ